MGTVDVQNLKVAGKKREHIDLIPIGMLGDRFRAEIPERWGKRVITIQVSDRPDIQEGHKRASFSINYVKKDSTITLPRFNSYKIWDLSQDSSKTFQELDKIVNDYYNSDLWLIRALRA